MSRKNYGWRAETGQCPEPWLLEPELVARMERSRQERLERASRAPIESPIRWHERARAAFTYSFFLPWLPTGLTWMFTADNYHLLGRDTDVRHAIAAGLSIAVCALFAVGGACVGWSKPRNTFD